MVLRTDTIISLDIPDDYRYSHLGSANTNPLSAWEE
jgi:predicted protein tyrosine phosphatase